MSFSVARLIEGSRGVKPGLKLNLLVYGSIGQCETLADRVLTGIPRSDPDFSPMTKSSGQLGYDSPRRVAMQKRRSNVWTDTLLSCMLAAATLAPAVAQAQQGDGGTTSMPKVGDVAPDFTLKYFDGNDLKDVSLSQYRGKKNVVVAFFIFAFTGG
jgi:hypothetical protein